MNLLLPETGLLFWMTLIFAIVFFVLAKFGFPVITGMVDKRTENINDALSKAKEAEKKLSSLSEEHEKMIARTNAECTKMLQDATSERDRMLEQARQQARNEADKIVADAKVRIESEKELALRQVRSEVAAMSVAIAGTILKKDLSSDKQQHELADQLFEQMKNVN